MSCVLTHTTCSRTVRIRVRRTAQTYSCRDCHPPAVYGFWCYVVYTSACTSPTCVGCLCDILLTKLPIQTIQHQISFKILKYIQQSTSQSNQLVTSRVAGTFPHTVTLYSVLLSTFKKSQHLLGNPNMTGYCEGWSRLPMPLTVEYFACTNIAKQKRGLLVKAPALIDGY